MKWILLIILTYCPLLRAAFINDLAQSSLHDWRTLYENERLEGLATWVLASGTLANTPLDQNIRHLWQHEIRSPTTKSIAKTMCKIREEGIYLIPLYLAAAYLGSKAPLLSPVGTWGDHAFRSILIVTPEYHALNWILGSSRPQKGPSHWYPFHSKFGVSGHALYGAIPFLSLAGTVEAPMAQGLFYGLSWLPGLARLDKDKHYLSQVVLGWGLAYLAVQTTFSSSPPKKLSYYFGYYPCERKPLVGVHVKYLL